MTIGQKSLLISAACDKQENCIDCPLCDETHCYSYASDEQIEHNYNLMFGSKNESAEDIIHSPSHYKCHKHECIDEMVEVFGIDAVMTFCKLNVWKYRYRSGAKNGKEDLDKADEYMDILIRLRNRNGETDAGCLYSVNES